jgi:hypothetical protein
MSCISQLQKILLIRILRRQDDYGIIRYVHKLW